MILSIAKAKYRGLRAFIRRSRLKNKSFSIISNNCWGSFTYQYFGLPYKSPFVGLFLYCDDYIKLLKNIHYYMDIELKFISLQMSRYYDPLNERAYPIGILGDVEIHFLHYKNEEEARRKWNNRKQRIDYDNLIVKYSEKDGSTDALLKEFLDLDFKRKVALTTKRYHRNKLTIQLENEFGDEIDDEWGSFLRTIKPNKLINELMK